MKEHSMRRVAIVTGASSGIGEALALAMASQGTHVVLVARSVDRLTALAVRIESAGGRDLLIAFVPREGVESCVECVVLSTSYSKRNRVRTALEQH